MRSTISNNTLSAGSHSITARYLGSAEHAPSTSSPVIQVVNGPQPAAPSYSIADTTVVEGTNPPGPRNRAQFTITRSGDTSASGSVGFHTESGTGPHRARKDSVDFKNRDTIVSFAPGETSKIVEVEIIGDSLTEVDEEFRGVLDRPVNGTITRNVGFCIIIDDDGPGSGGIAG